MAEVRQVKLLVDSAIQKLGAVDILVNNAGIFLPHDIVELDFAAYMDAFQRTIAVNLTGPAAAAHRVAEHLRSRGGGKIINVGSRGAFRGEAGQPGYGAAKAGLHAMSQSLAQALGPFGITVHAVAPGFIETAMARPHLQGEAGEAVKAQSPLNRVATVDEVAQAILYLSSEEARFTTGCVLDLNGASYLR
jgi:NAD(P)-dependent dehydrogenase (short-subunit alcohol dehydrogenase family)